MSGVGNGSEKCRHGKGDKDRLCYLANGSADAVAAWVAVRGSQPGPLFVRIGKGSRMTDSRLSDQAVRFILEAPADQAAVSIPRPHDARLRRHSPQLGIPPSESAAFSSR